MASPSIENENEQRQGDLIGQPYVVNCSLGIEMRIRLWCREDQDVTLSTTGTVSLNQDSSLLSIARTQYFA